MAAGDLLEVKYHGVYGTNPSITFTAVNENDLLLFFITPRQNHTVSTGPSGATLEASFTTGYPNFYAYSKIAGASESTTFDATISATESVVLIAFRYEGPLSGSEFTFSAINNANSVTTLNIPSSASSSATNGKALAVFATYLASTLDHAVDNSFVLDTTVTNPNYMTTTVGAVGYGIKTITHPDTDIQTTLTYGTSTHARGILVLIEPSSGEQIPNGNLYLTGVAPKKIARFYEKIPQHGT